MMASVINIKNFWIQFEYQIGSLTGKNENFSLLEKYMEKNNVLEGIGTDNQGVSHQLPGKKFDGMVEAICKELKQNNKLQTMNAVKYLVFVDKHIPIEKKRHVRNTLPENPHIIEHLVAKFVSFENKTLYDEILGFLQLGVSVVSKHTGWKWLMTIFLHTAIYLTQMYVNQRGDPTDDYLVAVLNLVIGKYVLGQGEEEQLAYDMVSMVYQLSKDRGWKIRKSFLYPDKKEKQSTALNMMEIVCLLYYKIIIELSSNLDQEHQVKGQLVHLYTSALRYLRDKDLDKCVSSFYNLTNLCEKRQHVFLECIGYSQLSYCFFLLRQTKDSFIFLQKMIMRASEKKIHILEALAHKQLALVLSCMKHFASAIYHFEKAQDIANKVEEIQIELKVEFEEVSLFRAEAMSYHRIHEGRFELYGEIQFKAKCSCSVCHSMGTKEIHQG